MPVAQHIDSPWRFKDCSMESDYQNDSIRDIVKRLRTPGFIWIIITWTMRLSLLWGLCFERITWSEAELVAHLFRLGSHILLTTMYFVSQSASQATQTTFGHITLWWTRLYGLPSELMHELGIRQYSTQLMMMQVMSLS